MRNGATAFCGRAGTWGDHREAGDNRDDRNQEKDFSRGESRLWHSQETEAMVSSRVPLLEGGVGILVALAVT